MLPPITAYWERIAHMEISTPFRTMFWPGLTIANTEINIISNVISRKHR